MTVVIVFEKKKIAECLKTLESWHVKIEYLSKSDNVVSFLQLK